LHDDIFNQLHAHELLIFKKTVGGSQMYYRSIDYWNILIVWSIGPALLYNVAVAEVSI